MSIRTKVIQQTVLNCPPGQGGGSQCTSHLIDVTVPIRDWSANPSPITSPSWSIGNVEPNPISLIITFPELEFVYAPEINFRYKLKKIVTGVDFINITSDTAALTGNVFNNLNLIQEKVKINFQNMDNLSVGMHEISLIIEAFSVDSNGDESFKEDSSIKNIIIPIKITVLSGTGFNTDKNTYQFTYNKADDSLSGDEKIIVYSSEAVAFTTSETFISFLQTAGSSERYLTFQKNTDLAAKTVGNYSGTVTITKGTQSKTVNVDLQVINDATQFYVHPAVFNISLQKNLAETKTLTANLSNPNSLTIAVDFFPSFVDSVTIVGTVITIITKNSKDFILGNYSGDIILKSGGVQKTITINLTVLQAITHDFSGSLFYFALDKNKVIVNKTNSAATYVKMVLTMYFKGFGKEFQESQTYTFPFFKGSAEIFPGEEVQDFFIKAKDIVTSLDPVYQYDLALVTMIFQEMSILDTVISTFSLDNIRFAPGKKPKCFPFFTDHPVRSTYSESVIKISSDQLTEKADNLILYDQYNLPKPAFVQKSTIDQFTFLRKEFLPNLKKSAIVNSIFQFIPLPEPQNIVHIEWETQNLVFDWFTAVQKTKESTEIENIIGESRDYREEKFDSSFSKPLTVNSGWKLEEEIDLITDLLLSRLCFIYIKGKRYKAFPIGKKNDLKDSENNKFSMDLEFKILVEK